MPKHQSSGFQVDAINISARKASVPTNELSVFKASIEEHSKSD